MIQLKICLAVSTLLIIVGLSDSYESVEGLGSTCLTHERSAGKCIQLSKCEFLKKKLMKPTTENVNYLRESQCGIRYDGPLVCCPSYVTKPAISDLLATNCRPTPSERIIGGYEAGLAELPWLALMNYMEKGSTKTSYNCAGSLITNRYILTAAHCVHLKNWELINVRLGEWNVTNPGHDCISYYRHSNGSLVQECTPFPIDVDIEEIISHPDYNEITKTNDIALVRLIKEIPTNGIYIQVGCLPLTESQRTEEFKEITIVGWGLNDKYVRSPTKQRAEIELVDFSTCKSNFRKLGLDLEQTQFCATGYSGSDTCFGDSGGSVSTIIAKPLQLPVQIIVGITSFGYSAKDFECGSTEVPSAYTRVSPFIEWISENLKP